MTTIVRPAAATGVCLPHRATAASDAHELAVMAESLGYDSVWVSEVATYDAIAIAGAIAVATERIRIGTAIVPVSTRTPALHAMGLSTLGHLAPGRAIVGFGISTPPIIEGWHGQDGVVGRALTHTRDLFAVLDQALTGARTSHVGRGTRSTGFRLEAPASTPPLRFLGALGPKMRAFAREHAHGLILNLAPRSALRAIAEEEQGSPAFEVVLPLRIAVGGDLSVAEARFRRELASYLRVPAYAAAIAGQGYADAVASVTGEHDLQAMADALPGEMVDDFAVLGDAGRARALLDAVRCDGVAPLIVPIVAPGDLSGFEAIMRAVAPATVRS